MELTNSIERASNGSSPTECLRECLALGALALDADGRICAFNAEAERLIGLKAPAVAGRTVEVLPEPLRAWITRAMAVPGGWSQASEPALILTGADGQPAPVCVELTRCLAEPGRCAGVLVTMHEVTAAKAFRANLQRLDRLATFGTLSAGMTHEIKNALVAVTTFIQDLVRRHQDSELTSLVGRELRRIDSMLTEMLNFAGPTRPVFVPLNIHPLLEHSLRLLGPQMEAKQIRLTVAFAAGTDQVNGDDYQLEQAFLNVLLNAINAMPEEGQLTVSTQACAGEPAPDRSDSPTQMLRVTISDTGPGIPSTDLGRLFEPFYSTKPHGTGLGLTIARRIILDHRGKIGVETELGNGTDFHISLPLAHSNG